VLIINSRAGWFIPLILFFAAIHDANGLVDQCVNEATWQEQKKHIVNVNLTGVGVITAWGVTNWHYFTNSPQSRSEHWFQNDTSYGGADKVGHLYASYVSTHGLSYLYEFWCINKADAALYGALSSMMILGYMEAGDSFSDFGFSREDFVANVVGSSLGYYLYINPDLSSKIDLRWEYGVHPEKGDFLTDYGNTKYLIALKLNGFEFSRSNFLKHIELHVGYYTRGFDNVSTVKERNLFFGIGLNLTDLLRRHSYKKTSTVLRYIQVPGTNIEFKKDRNQ
jgi:hypothetical protein